MEIQDIVMIKHHGVGEVTGNEDKVYMFLNKNNPNYEKVSKIKYLFDELDGKYADVLGDTTIYDDYTEFLDEAYDAIMTSKLYTFFFDIDEFDMSDEEYETIEQEQEEAMKIIYDLKQKLSNTN